jgi:hypothetical protein
LIWTSSLMPCHAATHIDKIGRNYGDSRINAALQ